MVGGKGLKSKRDSQHHPKSDAIRGGNYFDERLYRILVKIMCHNKFMISPWTCIKEVNICEKEL